MESGILVNIGLGNGLMPGCTNQSITWAYTGLLSFGSLKTSANKI